MKILIVDDNIRKTNDIVNVIEETLAKNGNAKPEIYTETYVNSAKRILETKSIDILILDICLPLIPGSEIESDAGIKLLKQIQGSERYSYPRYVVAVSEYKDMISQFDIDTKMVHSSVEYNESGNWKEELSQIIQKVTPIILNNIRRRSFDYDVAVICALEEELSVVKKMLQEVKEVEMVDDQYIYFRGTFEKDNKIRRVIMAKLPDMGMVAASTITTKMIYHFSPRYIIMTGIAAGVRGKVNFGDVILAQSAWDYGAGKEVYEEGRRIHRNTIQQISVDPYILNTIDRISRDVDLLREIKDEFLGEKPSNELKIVTGPVATGSSVVATSQVVEEIIENQTRDTVGLEMEIYGMYYAARWAISPRPKYLALKSVCDFADSEKDDKYHAYASYASARVFFALATKFLAYEEW